MTAKIVQQCVAQNIPIPEKIANAPTLNFGLEFYYSAFLTLSPSRPVYFGGIGLIPWSEIKLYCDHHGLCYEDSEDAIYIIKKLDEAFVKHQSKKEES